MLPYNRDVYQCNIFDFGAVGCNRATFLVTLLKAKYLWIKPVCCKEHDYHLLDEHEQWEHQNNMWNLFNYFNYFNYFILVSLFLLWINFRHCFSVSSRLGCEGIPRWSLENSHERYTNADLKIFLYVCVHIKYNTLKILHS